MLEPTGIDSTEFRRVLGYFASGLTVITSSANGEPFGFTCQAFASLSLDPPLVVFCPSAESTTWPRIRQTGHFCANVLAADQAAVAQAFARSGGDKFAGVGWAPGPGGAPILGGVLAWVAGSIDVETDVGDHAIVVGRVYDLASVADVEPLLFFRGRYGAFREVPP
jgi:flavin reductase (DIM6/NTAB) family NADH-FMN oxidoreductase RutF